MARADEYFGPVNFVPLRSDVASAVTSRIIAGSTKIEVLVEAARMYVRTYLAHPHPISTVNPFILSIGTYNWDKTK